MKTKMRKSTSTGKLASWRFIKTFFHSYSGQKFHDDIFLTLPQSNLRDMQDHPQTFCSDVTHHPDLGLGLLHQIILFRLADAGEDARLRVEVQHVALEICEEVAKTTNATHPHHTLDERDRRKCFDCLRKTHSNVWFFKNSNKNLFWASSNNFVIQQ